MRTRVSKLVSVAVAIALMGTAQAGEQTQKRSNPSKEQGIGMASGTVIGALVGGPFGAGVGFIVGTLAGTHAEQVRATAKKAQELEAKLDTTQEELLAAQSALEQAAAQSTVALANEQALLTQMAERLRADVMFRTGSAELDAASAAMLGELGKVLGSYAKLSITVDGYADPRGKAGENMELSQQRASAVRAALISGGANPAQIEVLAHGEQLSTATKGDLDAYAWERRVSLSVVPASAGQVAKIQ